MQGICNKIAKELNFPENVHEYEIFDTNYGCDFTDRPVVSKLILDMNEMLKFTGSYGLPVRYTYVIDGEYDKDGNKL